MDQADSKLGVFYQHQIAKIAKLAREQTRRDRRKHLDVMLNQYIDILLVMSKPSERTRAAKARLVLATQQCGRVGRPTVAARSGDAVGALTETADLTFGDRNDVGINLASS